MEYKGWFHIKSKQTELVLDVQGACTDDSTPVIVWTKKTEGVENQLWKYNNKTHELKPRLCDKSIDVRYGHPKNGAEIVIYTSHGNANQQWYFQKDGTIQSGLGDQWVLDVEGANTAAGTRVILYERKEDWNDNQLWDACPYIPQGQFYIRSVLNDLYLGIRDGSDETCAPLCLGEKDTCGDDRYQQWTYNEDTGALCSVLNGNAIDVRDASAVNSAEIISYPCHNGCNQKWTFKANGAIVSGLGDEWVLDDQAFGGVGNPIILYTWNGGENQQWYISDE